MARRRKVRWHLIAVLSLVLVFVVVVLQNTQVVRIQLLFWSLSMSRILLLLFSLVVGFAVGYYVARRGRGRDEDYATVGKQE